MKIFYFILFLTLIATSVFGQSSGGPVYWIPSDTANLAYILAPNGDSLTFKYDGSNWLFLGVAHAPLSSPTFTGIVTIPTPFTLGATSVSITGAEMNYLAGVSSGIQSQLDFKTADSIGIDLDGDGTPEAWLYGTGDRGVMTLSEGANITFTLTGDTLEIAGLAGAGTADSVGIDLDGDGTPDSWLYGTGSRGMFTLSEGANITFTLTGDTLEIAGPAASGTADSVGIDIDGDGTPDSWLYGTGTRGMFTLSEGTGVTFTLTGDTLGIATTLGVSIDLAAEVTGILPVENGGTETTTLTDGGVLLGSGTAAITPMAVLGDGAIIVGDAVGDPVALTAFTSSTGDVVHEAGGLEADVSVYSGLVAVSGGVTSEINSKTELEGQIADVADFAEADGDIYSGAHNFSGASPVTISSPDLVIKIGTAPTAEADMEWNSTTDRLLVGDGAGTKTFYPDAHYTSSDFSDSSITLLNATAWRMFFSNATSTAIQELVFGDVGKVLTSGGASANPTWETPAAADSGLWDFTDNKDTVSLYGTADTVLKITRNAVTNETKVTVPVGTLIMGDIGLTQSDSLAILSLLRFGADGGGPEIDSSLADSMINQKGVYAAGGGSIDSVGISATGTDYWNVNKSFMLRYRDGINVSAGGDSSGTDTIAISASLGTTIVSSEITDDEIVNADINSSAAILYSKLAFSNSIVAGDIATSAVTTAEVLNGTLIDEDMANDALNPDRLVGDAVDNNKIDSNIINNPVSNAVADASGNVIPDTYYPFSGPGPMTGYIDMGTDSIIGLTGIVTDTVEISGDVIGDFNGPGLIVTNNVLTVTGRIMGVINPSGPVGGAGSIGPGDSTILELPSHDGVGVYVLYRDSSIDASGDIQTDTVYIPFRMPSWAETLDSVCIVFKGKSVTADSAEISKVEIWGPTQLSSSFITDSSYYEDVTARNSTSVSRIALNVNNTQLQAGDPFTVMIEHSLGANVNGVVYVYSVEAKVSE